MTRTFSKGFTKSFNPLRRMELKHTNEPQPLRLDGFKFCTHLSGATFDMQMFRFLRRHMGLTWIPNGELNANWTVNVVDEIAMEWKRHYTAMMRRLSKAPKGANSMLAFDPKVNYEIDARVILCSLRF